MKQIIWKDIEGYEGLYKISNYGQVKSLSRIRIINSCNQFGAYTTQRRTPELILKPNFTFDKYFYVNLYDLNGIKSLKKIHRLVAKHFIIGDESLVVNHIDGNKLNNSYNNLEWVTVKENTNHAEKLGLRNSKGSGNNNATLCESDVIDIRVRQCRGENKLLIYADYKDRIGISGFYSIWYNRSWQYLKI